MIESRIKVGNEYLSDGTNINKCLSEIKKHKLDVNVVFDLGARDCAQSIQFANNFPNAKIYSFEPNPNMIGICESNIKDYKNINLVKKAVNSFDGKCKFFSVDREKTRNSWEDGNQGASSLFEIGEKYRTYTNEEIFCNETEVECTRLDSFINENSIDSVDVIHMDIQGAEEMALLSLMEHLKNVKFIQTELITVPLYEGLADNQFILVNKVLVENNFQLVYGDPDKIGWTDYGYINKKFMK